MKKRILVTISLAIILILGGCTSTKPSLRGFYQSERINDYYVQMSIDDNSFVEYIDNREVDKGTYERLEEGIYKFKSDKQDFEITLNDDNSFEIIIKKLNHGEPILMKNLGAVPTTFSTVFDDVDEFKALLDDEDTLDKQISTADELIIDIGESAKFTKEEITNAVNLVKNNFDFPATTLIKIWYDEEKSESLVDIYLKNGRGSVNGVKSENVIIILSEFYVDDSGDNPVLNPDDTYTDYQWILIRDSKTSDWIIDDQGY